MWVLLNQVIHVRGIGICLGVRDEPSSWHLFHTSLNCSSLVGSIREEQQLTLEVIGKSCFMRILPSSTLSYERRWPLRQLERNGGSSHEAICPSDGIRRAVRCAYLAEAGLIWMKLAAF